MAMACDPPLLTAVSGSADVLFSPPSRGDELSVSIKALLIRTAEQHDAGHVDIWREFITKSLRGWLESDRTNQRDFWRLFDTLARDQIDLAKFTQKIDIRSNGDVNSNVVLPLGTITIAANHGGMSNAWITGFDCKRLAELKEANQLLVIDGQHRAFAQHLLTRDLSSQSIECIINNVLLELESQQNIGSLGELFRVFTATLSRTTAEVIRFNANPFKNLNYEEGTNSTRRVGTKFLYSYWEFSSEAVQILPGGRSGTGDIHRKCPEREL